MVGVLILKNSLSNIFVVSLLPHPRGLIDLTSSMVTVNIPSGIGAALERALAFYSDSSSSNVTKWNSGDYFSENTTLLSSCNSIAPTC